MQLPKAEIITSYVAPPSIEETTAGFGDVATELQRGLVFGIFPMRFFQMRQTKILYGQTNRHQTDDLLFALWTWQV